MADFKNNELGNQASDVKSKLDEMIELLPQPLRDTVATLNTQDERRIGMYSAITMAGSLMPNVHIHYDQKKSYPSLYLIIIMPPASGKGVLNSLGKVLTKVDKELTENYNTNVRDYNTKLVLYNRDLRKGKPSPLPEKPNLSLLRLAGNITSSMFHEQLAENNGREFLIVIETEMDSLGLASQKGGFGNLNSTILRSAFEFESLSQMRKTNNERLFVETPKLSVILSGTESQVRNIFHSNADGLLSRFLVVKNLSVAEWRSVKPTSNSALDEIFTSLADSYYELWKFQKPRRLEVKFSDEQWQQIDSFGSVRLEASKLHHGENAHSITKRHANMVARMATALAVLRAKESKNYNYTIHCSDDDFKIALWLGEESFTQALDLYESLPGETSVPSNNKDKQFLDQLPDTFTVDEIKKSGKVKHITDRTLFRRLEQLRKKGFLENIKKGSYKKMQWQD